MTTTSDDGAALFLADGPAMALDVIRVRGARVHNLKDLDVDLPRGQLTVITGPSGSGKSSLAFDTLYAEGQRQYLDTLSVYARQFLHPLERPDVDLIDGLPPTIAIDQRSGGQNPRSTVATVTEIHDYLRLLFARVGQAYCTRCDQPISQQTTEEIVTAILELPAEAKAMVLAPLVRGRKGKHLEALDVVRKAGFARVRIDGETYPIESAPELAPRKLHDIEAVIDRIIIQKRGSERLNDSIRLALKHGDGLVLVTYQDSSPDAARADGKGTWRDRLFSTRFACPECKLSFTALEPRSFSYNSPYGACPACQGLGIRLVPDAQAPPPNGDRSLDDNQAAGGLHERTRPQPPADGNQGSENIPCADCQGTRLRCEARACRVGGQGIHQITAMTITAARQFLVHLAWTGIQREIAAPIISQIVRRLAFLEKVGAEYLTLDRPADTLSGGEMQRVRLATGIGSGLVGVCYLLDEPSIGLHARDNQRLIDALRDLEQQGNTVVVVEHDAAMMRAADHLIDMGPGAGEHGGRVVAQGTPSEVGQNNHCITGQYLAGKRRIPLPPKRRAVSQTRSIQLIGATTNNLQNVTIRFPLGVLVCVTGVSGSGKSSLVLETLAKAVARRLGQQASSPGPHRGLRGVRQIGRLVEVDQSPIGRTPRSNPATYAGLFDEIRKIFARTKEARQQGFKAGRFSFNVRGGRCEACQGQGVQKLEMHFLPDMYATCPECEGARFNGQTLLVRYRERSIADVLGMRVQEALDFFSNFPPIQRPLACLDEVGLGYITLGQPANTLSGGEAQRIKLATELARPTSGHAIYILDEPTTGLHFSDVSKLLDVLQRLVDVGNTVLVIEHHLDVIKQADWIIDLGPEGGQGGGRVVAVGTPEEIAGLDDNATGRFLREVLDTSR